MEQHTEQEEIVVESDNLTVESPVEEVSETQEPEIVSPEEKLQAELSEAKDKYLRLYAEFENFRRRTAKEKMEMMQNASESLIKELLPILDDYDRANQALETATEIEPVKEGLGLIFTKIHKTLAAKGLKIMEAKEQDFNPDFHECITQFPAGEELKNKVIDVVEQGYFLNEKVIRYAKVVVGQ